MRIRLPELLNEHEPKLTAYEVAKRSHGRIIPSTLYRLVRSKGEVKFIDSDMLEALFDVLKLERIDQLLELRATKKGKGRK